MSERDELNDRALEIGEELSTWASLMKHPGWHKLLEFAFAQQDNRVKHTMLNPCLALDDALPQEFMKGEFSGIGLVLKFPEVEKERLQAEAERIERELEELPSDENGGSTGSGATGFNGERKPAHERELFVERDSDAYGDH